MTDIDDPVNDLKRKSSKGVSFQVEHHERKQNYIGTRYKLKILFYLVIIFLHTFLVYIIKPLCFVLGIIFLTAIVNIKVDEEKNELSHLLKNGVITVGWVILFILPIYNLFAVGLKIIAIHKTYFSKFLAFILLMIEIIVNLPCTFIYPNNLYSIFLFEEKGIEQLLSPWLIFFPTVYIKSICEIIRNFIDPLFFLIVGFLKLHEVRDNPYQTYLIIILQIMLAACIIRIIGNIIILIIRIKSSLKKGWKVKK